MEVGEEMTFLEDHIRGMIYGNAIGDAIGLLSEFMTDKQAETYYGAIDNLEYSDKVPDFHRNRFEKGDWTDDTDQMVLIMQSLITNQGKVSAVDFGERLKFWARKGFPELGDVAGMGLGSTTSHVLRHGKFNEDPHAAAFDIWEKSGRFVAPNGAIMRTSVLGAYQHDSLEQVRTNTLEICKATHFDPRCQASTVAMTTAIALMLQQSPDCMNDDGSFNIQVIMKKSYDVGKQLLPKKSEHKELKRHLFAKKIASLKLSEDEKIGYTYKCLGAGFWALQQNDFRAALQSIVMAAGDADTNGAVAGALLGCKFGAKQLPSSWLDGLLHREWLDVIIDKFLLLVIPSYKRKFSEGYVVPPIEPNNDMKLFACM